MIAAGLRNFASALLRLEDRETLAGLQRENEIDPGKVAAWVAVVSAVVIGLWGIGRLLT